MPSIEVGILGATGMVGQQFIALLADHPWFKVTYLGASERSAGKAFKDAAAWRLPNRLPEDVANRVVEAAAPGTAPKLVFSGLDSSVAGEIEAEFARAGHIVVSNSRNYRMVDTVPLLIPEVNAEHLRLLDLQGEAQGWKGRVGVARGATAPDCASHCSWVRRVPRRPMRAASARAASAPFELADAVDGEGQAEAVVGLDQRGAHVGARGGQLRRFEHRRGHVDHVLLVADGQRAVVGIGVVVLDVRGRDLDDEPALQGRGQRAGVDVGEAVLRAGAGRGGEGEGERKHGKREEPGHA
jgi:hypothetical protein